MNAPNSSNSENDNGTNSGEGVELSPVKRALLALKKMDGRLQELEGRAREPIAVVGMSCRLPGSANDPEAYWQNLAAAKNGVREISKDRWDVDEFYDPDYDRPGKMSTRWAGLIDRVDEFDAFYFGISPREALRMDPQQRLLLEVSVESLEDAGYPLESLSNTRTGVFLGVMQSEYATINQSDIQDIDAYSFVSTGITANRISFYLNLRGPSFTVETQCSSSLVAIHQAVRALRNGECEMALAGGANMILLPQTMVAFTKWGILNNDGSCKTFDARANGIVRGEGCGVIVLKRLSDAERDGDNILALIRGSAVNHDGRTNVLTAPSGMAQRDAIRQALADAHVDPEEVSFIECHGTGTPLGDPIEVDALNEVYGEAGDPEDECYLGSVKTNIGHLEGAAGVAAVIKTIQCLRKKQIPPNLHFKSLNPEIQIEDGRLDIATELMDWEPADGAPRLAGVSSFGAGGTNAHMILEEAPEYEDASEESEDEDQTVDQASADVTLTERDPQLLLLSARTPAALESLALGYRDWLARPENKAIGLRRLAYNSALRRTHHEHRLSMAVYSRAELDERLEAYLGGQKNLAGMFEGAADSRGGKPKLAFVCSGQGANFWPLSRQLLEHEPAFRETLERCEEIVKEYAGWSLIHELTAAESRLEEPQFIMPAMAAVQISLAEMWFSYGVRPDAVIGSSLGEIPAAYIAGALSLESALRIVVPRGEIMGRLRGQGAMTNVILSAADAREFIEDVSDQISVAVVNSPGTTIIAGDPTAMQSVHEKFRKADVNFKELASGGLAGHSPMMDQIRPEFVETIQSISPRESKCRFISTVTGAELPGTELSAEYWGRNIREPVNFAEGLRGLLDDGFRLFIEVAPHPVLSIPVQQTAKAHAAGEATILPSLNRKFDPRQVFHGSLGGLHAAGYGIDFEKIFAREERSFRGPVYGWDRERYWPDTSVAFGTGARRTQKSQAGENDAGRNSVADVLDLKSRSPIEAIHAAPEMDRPQVIKQYLAQSLAEVMQIPAGRLKTEVSLNQMGLESFMSVELSNRIEGDFGVKLLPARFTSGATLDEISEELYAKVTASGGLTRQAGEALSERQLAVWLQQNLRRESGAWNVYFAARMHGELDVPALGRAWQRVLARYPVLNSIYVQRGDAVVRMPAGDLKPDIVEVDATRWTFERLRREIQMEANRPFALDRELPVRLRTASVTPRRHYMLLAIHQIAVDEESLPVLLKELQHFYQLEVRGADNASIEELAAVPDYGEFISAEQSYLESAEAAQALDALLERLRDQPSILELPGRNNHSRAISNAAAVHRLNLDSELSQTIAAHAEQAAGESGQAISPATTVLAAAALLLRRYSSQDRIVLGTLANRSAAAPGTGQEVGNFTNPVAVALDLRENSSFAEILAGVSRALSESLEGNVARYPFRRLVRELRPTRYPETDPLFQISFTISASPESFLGGASEQKENFDALRLIPLEIPRTQLAGDLNLRIIAAGSGGLALEFEYRKDRFSDSFIEKTASRIRKLLTIAMRDAGLKRDEMQPLTVEDTRLVQLLNDYQPREATGMTIPELIAGSAARFPGAPAVQIARSYLTPTLEDVPGELSYADLERKSNQLANQLTKQECKAKANVVLLARPSLGFTVGLLGILKAGATCVLLDPEHSDEMLRNCVENSGAKFAVVAAELGEHPALAPAAGSKKKKIQTIVLDESCGSIARVTAKAPAVKVKPEHPALLQYSVQPDGGVAGSLHSHAAVLNTVLWLMRGSESRFGARVLMPGGAGAAINVEELLFSLGLGAVCVIPPSANTSGEELLQTLNEQQISRAILRPAQIDSLANLADEQDQLPHYLREILTYGEKVLMTQSIVNLLGALRSCRFEYLYHARDAGLIASLRPGNPGSFASEHLPVGRAIDNTRLYLLDPLAADVSDLDEGAQRQLTLPGMPGELFVEGPGLTSGYYKNKKLTADRFIANPYFQQSKNQLFRTGLMARYDRHGNLHILGRRDQYVSIRDRESSLREIEGLIEQHPAASSAMVVAHPELGGNGLIAYVVSDRIVDRLATLVRCRVEFKDEKFSADLVTRDISPGGLSLHGRFEEPIWQKQNRPVRLRLTLPGMSEEFAIDGVIMWTEESSCGIRFDADPLEQAALKMSLDHIRELEELSLSSNTLLETRVAMRRQCTVTHADGRQSRLWTVEISGSGINLAEVPEDWQVGKRVRLRVKLPGVLQEAEFRCVLAWRDEDRTGFNFELTDETRVHLRHFFGHYSKRRLLSLSQLRRFLQERLPYYRIPAIFVILDALPERPDGTIDRAALQFPVRKWHELQEAMKAPRSSVEGLILGLWSDALGVEQPGLYDNFFDLGGDSLLAVQVHRQICEQFNLSFPLRDFFVTPTVADLAARVIQVEQQANTENVKLLREIEEASELVSTEQKSETRKWILRPEPNSNARLRLFCFHYAGGNARIFHNWWKDLPDEVEVCAIQMPGRDERMLEKPYTDFFPLIKRLQEAIAPFLDGTPFAFFGHSLGCIISYELSRQLRRQKNPLPEQLFLSAGLPPNALQHDVTLKEIFERDTIEFARDLDGIPEEVLRDQGMMRMVLPLLRSDLSLVKSYHYIEESLLETPITVFAGEQDKLVGPDLLNEWRKLTSGGFDTIGMSGDHFFIHSERDILLGHLNRALVAILERSAVGASV